MGWDGHFFDSELETVFIFAEIDLRMTVFDRIWQAFEKPVVQSEGVTIA